MSPILRYYGDAGTDDRGRTLAETQALDASRMEYYHDFIQWMFPLREASRYNPEAPVLTDDDVRAFHARPDLRENLGRSFAAFLRFLGLEFVDGTVRPRRSRAAQGFRDPQPQLAADHPGLALLEDPRSWERESGVLRVFAGCLRGRRGGHAGDV